MDRMIKRYLSDISIQIERRNQTSDNKASHIRYEKQHVIESLLKDNRISESDVKEAKRILRIR